MTGEAQLPLALEQRPAFERSEFLVSDSTRTETEGDIGLFHALNRANDAGVDILLSSRVMPGRWRDRLPDLVSRLRSAPTVNIGRPDDALIATVLTKLLRDRQLGAGDDVIAYLVRHMERSFKAAQHTVAAADALALAEHRRITVPLIRRVLEQ